MLLNPPSHCYLTLFRTWLVVRTPRTKAVSPTCAANFFSVGLLSLDPSTMIGTPQYLTFVILFPSFADRFPSASCTIHFHTTRRDMTSFRSGPPPLYACVLLYLFWWGCHGSCYCDDEFCLFALSSLRLLACSGSTPEANRFVLRLSFKTIKCYQHFSTTNRV